MRVSQLKDRAGDSRKARSANRGVLGLFAAVCLNLVIQPCAIAMAGDSDCLHCPPAAGEEMAAHHGHHAAAETDEAPCAALEAPCGDLDGVSLDQRGGQAKTKFSGDTSAAPVTELPAVELFRTEIQAAAAGPPGTTRASPPLNLLYCVFLK